MSDSMFDSGFGLEPIDGLGSSRDLPLVDFSSQRPLPDLVEARDSSTQLQADHSHPVIGGADFWLEGEAAYCGCPDCGAPMAIRIWLMIADCWRCGASIEMTETQERQIERLMQQRSAQPVAPEPAQSTPKPQQTPRPQTKLEAEPQAESGPKKTESRPKSPPQLVAKRFKGEVPTRPASEPATDPAAGRRVSIPQRQRRTTAARVRMRDQLRRMSARAAVTWLFNNTPAWLISLIFHLLLFIFLALLNFTKEKQGPEIVLSLSIGKYHREGGREVESDPTADIAVETPIPENVDMDDPEIAQQVAKDRQDAKDLMMNPQEKNPALPSLEKVVQQINTTAPRQTLVGRDPRVRAEMLKRAGGTTATEAAVARGLRWLAMRQRSDGSWRLKGHSYSARAPENPTAATALALLPFLGAGQTPTTGKYRDVVGDGLDWLLKHQNPDGGINHYRGAPNLYAHGQAAIVLCEAYAMTQNEALRRPAQKAIDYIVAAQHSAGGWRYLPKQPGDTSVLGWQVMALQSAKNAQLEVPTRTLDLASRFLDSVDYVEGTLYAYQRPRIYGLMRALRAGNRAGIEQTMTAEGLLCRMYLGWDKNDSRILDGLDILRAKFPADEEDEFNVYYLYYATQAFRQVGGKRWYHWNEGMRKKLLAKQVKRGSDLGSWIPEEVHDRGGGQLYMTSLCVCSLEVYYRYLPIFQPEK